MEIRNKKYPSLRIKASLNLKPQQIRIRDSIPNKHPLNSGGAIEKMETRAKSPEKIINIDLSSDCMNLKKRKIKKMELKAKNTPETLIEGVVFKLVSARKIKIPASAVSSFLEKFSLIFFPLKTRK